MSSLAEQFNVLVLPRFDSCCQINVIYVIMSLGNQIFPQFDQSCIRMHLVITCISFINQVSSLCGIVNDRTP